MGQTLTVAAQWTTAIEKGRGKLEYTPSNEAILNSIYRFSIINSIKQIFSKSQYL